MKIKIQDLLRDAELSDMIKENAGVVSAERIKELTMEKIETGKAKHISRAGKRILTLSLAAALLLALGVTAYAAGWFGLREATISEETLADSFSDGQYRGKAVIPARVITLAGYEGTQEYQASREWRAFYNDYVSHNYYGDAFGQDLGDWGSLRHIAYAELYTPALCDKFREISERYGLTTRTGRYEAPSYNNYADLCEIAGIPVFLGTEGRNPLLGGFGDYTVYDDGSFTCVDTWWPKGDFENDLGMLYDIRLYRNVKGSMDTGFVAFGAEEQPEEWAYTTAQGDTVDLVLGRDKALILCEGDGAYVTVVLAQLQIAREHGVTVDRTVLEHYADTVDFAALGSAGSVNFPGSGTAYVIPTPEPEA